MSSGDQSRHSGGASTGVGCRGCQVKNRFKARCRRTRHSKQGRMLCQTARLRYGCIRDNQSSRPVRLICSTPCVHTSGFYQWLKQPESKRAGENKRLTKQVKGSWLDSGGIDGSPRIQVDLREACTGNRVSRLIASVGIKVIRGYEAQRYRVGSPAGAAKNPIQCEFIVNELNKA